MDATTLNAFLRPLLHEILDKLVIYTPLNEKGIEKTYNKPMETTLLIVRYSGFGHPTLSPKRRDSKSYLKSSKYFEFGQLIFKCSNVKMIPVLACVLEKTFTYFYKKH